MKVLAIEDGADDALLIERALADKAELHFASNGADGVERVASVAFDVVLLDY